MSIAPLPRSRLVALVGGSGFLGTAAAELFAAAGWRVVAVCRKPANARHLKPLGDLGQIAARFGDVRRPETLAAALQGADAVVNLVGVLDQKGGQGFFEINRRGAGAVAAAAAAAGAGALVQLSAIGADPRAESAYARSKAGGEAAVQKAFPAAAILRPSAIFGAGDQFTNRFAALVAAAPVVPVIAPETRMQPVFVKDVAAAIVAATERQLAGAATEEGAGAGTLHELAGPEILTIRQIVEFVADATGNARPLFDTPALGARLLARLSFLPGAPLTREQWLLLREDNLPSGQHPGLADFGIEPMSIASAAPLWLGRYRAGGRFTAAG